MWLNKLLLILILWKSSDALLIRSPSVYQSIIAGMNERYKFDSLTLIHGYTQYNPYENIELATKLVKLQIHFARLLIPTAIMSVEFFKNQEIPRLNLYNKPFFVFLNDFDELKNQLTPDFLKAVAKSERVSLIFFRDKTKVEDFFQNMFIPMNCQFMVAKRNQSDESNEIITEVYRFTEHGDLQNDFLTSWNPVTGMQLPKKFLHHRRTNFRGHNINVGWADEYHFRNPLIGVTVNNITRVILNKMEQEFNLNITYHDINNLGDCYANDTCTHAIAKLVSKEFDMISKPITTMFKNLDGYADLSMTSHRAIEYIYFKKHLYAFKWLAYGRIFHFYVWIFLGVHIVMTSIAIILIEYKKKAMLLGDKVKKLIPLNVSDIFFRVWSMFNNQIVPYSNYTQVQILQIICYLLFIIIYAVYSAKLVSFLAISSEEIPFLSLEEAQRKNIFIVDSIQNSETVKRYTRSTIFTQNTSYPKLVMAKRLSRNLFEGFNRVCKKNNYIFIDLPEYVDYFRKMIKVSCDIRRMMNYPYYFSYALQKDSILKRYINNIIIQSKERGIHRYPPIYPDDNALVSEKTSGIDITHIRPLLSFLMMSQLFSIIILIFEMVIHKLNLKQNKTIKSKRIWNIIKWPSKRIYALRRRTLKAKHRRSRKKFHRYC